MPAEGIVPPEPRDKPGDFLAHEFTRVRDLPENAPNQLGDHVELFWALVVGLSKTMGTDVATSIALVRDFLLTQAPELKLPATLNVGPDRMKLVQEKIRAYTVEPSYIPDFWNVSSSSMWPARKASIIISIVLIGGLAFNHLDAVTDHKVSPYGVFFLPLFLPFSLAGIIDPRIAWAVGSSGHLMPRKYRVMGVWLALFGAALTVVLAFYYGIW